MIADRIIQLIEMHLERRAEMDKILIEQLRDLIKHGVKSGQIHSL